MRTYTLPDGRTITWGGDLQEKIRILALIGIDYTPTAEELDEEARTQQLKDEYQSTISTLQQIEGLTNPTNAQVVQAVKFLAKTQRLTLKLLARMIRS
jgi:hypothetical protein